MERNFINNNRLMKILKNEQGTDEWLNDRKLHMTASNATAIASNGSGLETYIKKLVMENFCTNIENYTNADMERGNELEPLARDMYFLQTGNEVEEVGFVELSKYVGASPDGLVGKDGLLEIKSPRNNTHFDFILNEKIKSIYIWQMQMQMYVIDRKWCDFASYNPNFEKELVIKRVERNELAISKIKTGIIKGEEMIEKLIEQYKEKL